ncbi:MAG: hypothetical protein KDA05_02505 [Phycisphaerales bacterium]|nr:hypothetical protein [Phycisphaerales bacterium]
MDIVVSPYHLTTREAPAMAALQLADRAITMMPTPFAGTAKRDVEGAVAAAERIVTGLGWKAVAAPVRCVGEVTSADRDACWELGATAAATLL